MDPFTHGILGASAALTRAKTNRTTLAAAIIAGLCGGMFPDIDIFIRSAENPLLQIQYHRHFTHALVFVPLGAAIVALGLWPLLRRYASLARLWMFAALGMVTHGVLDAFTSYGTHLFWPFTNARTSWSFVSVVDPIVTIALLIGVIGFYRSHKRAWVIGALAFFALYLGFGGIQNYRTENAMRALAQTRGHSVELIEVKSTLFNNIVWRSNYTSNGVIYNDGWYMGPFGGMVHYPGGQVPQLNMARDFPTLPTDSVLAHDIEKFRFFSAGFVGVKPDDPSVIGDFRYALLPDAIGPLWGIRIDTTQPSQHPAFESFRQMTDATWARFFAMLRGKELPPS
jgi:inner membrane protein